MIYIDHIISDLRDFGNSIFQLIKFTVIAHIAPEGVGKK